LFQVFLPHLQEYGFKEACARREYLKNNESASNNENEKVDERVELHKAFLLFFRRMILGR